MSKASPIIVRSTCRSETKIAAGRHLTDVAGTRATAKQAIAIPSPSTIRIELKSSEPPPPDFEWNTLGTPTAPAVVNTVTVGRVAVVVVVCAIFFFLTTAFLCRTFYFGFTCVCTVGRVELELGTTGAGDGA
jgi:hypothetical protein